MSEQFQAVVPRRGQGAHFSARRSVNTATSSAVMAAGTLASRGLGFLKGILIAWALGALGHISNVFDMANTLPNLLYLMLAGGVFNVVLVPQIIKASKLPDRGADYLSRLLTLAVLFLAVITIPLTLFAQPILGLLTQLRGEQLILGGQFATFLIPQIFFYGLYTLLGQVLNAHDRFGSYMWAPVVNNLIAIAGLVIFIATWGTVGTGNDLTVAGWTNAQTWLLAGTTTLGVIAQAAILLIPVYRLGLGLRPRFGWHGMGLGHTGKIAGWALSTMLVGQLSYIVIGWVGSAATQISETKGLQDIPQTFILNRASDIYILPHSLIVLSVATVLFNQMSRVASNHDLPALRASVSRLLRIVGVATAFFAMLLFVLSGQIGMVIGGNSQKAGLAMGIAIAILALSSPFLSANFMINRVFYASEDARTPFVLQSILVVFGVGTALAVSFVPVQSLVYALLAMEAVGNVLAPFLAGLVLRNKIGDYGLRRIIRAYVQYALAAVISAVVGGIVLLGLGGASFLDGSYSGFAWRSTTSALLTIVVVTLVMGLVYGLALKLMRVEELDELLAPLTRRLSPLLAALSRRVPGLTPLLGRLPGATSPRAGGHPIGSNTKEDLRTGRIPRVPVGEESVAHTIELGTVLGGRYKVTAQLLASAEGDVVLEGSDQVLSRPVSIVVPGQEHVEHLTQGAREVATGERPASFQILDLGTSKGITYLITSRANPADLLDLVIPTVPYIEPHFTDTLGMQIFGDVRPPAPMLGSYDYVYDDDSPVPTGELRNLYQGGGTADHPQPQTVHPAPTEGTTPVPQAASAPVAPVTRTDSPQPTPATQATAAPSTAASVSATGTTASGQPKVTLLGQAQPAASSTSSISARAKDAWLSTPLDQARPAPATSEPEYDDDEANAPRGGRWLVGAILVVVLLAAIVFAASTIGNLMGSKPSSSSSPVAQQSTPGASGSNSGTPVVAPVIAGVTVQAVGGDQGVAERPDSKLSALYDGNPATTWLSYEFANPKFGGLAKSVVLVVELQARADLHSVTLSQQGGSGGAFEVLVSDTPSLDAAKVVSPSSFTGPDITVAIPGGTQAKYVFLNFTELPKLQSAQNYPYGLKISEITVK
ncbi:lipid II flippase MurJ [Psychromicrobium xiongbiense]|uniref:lipid II flippase MurJ n=1 Tax=Psychromicrobium xiongbiense TaxID=3051184 RepID=UPI0025566A57|nr:murein biosynthesis integral membrane protein MurJ [Psychromicrobium sp. YIM S02556]